MEPKFQVQLKIRKPVETVFDAVVNPKHLSGYFVQKANGPIVEGATVLWKFPEFDEEFPVIVRQVVPNDRIVFEWESQERGYNTRVEMTFKAIDAGNTLVQVSESGWRQTTKGIESSYSNCSGWMHMMMAMKGYLEHGINLREGGVY